MKAKVKSNGSTGTVVLKKTGSYVKSHQNSSASPPSMPARVKPGESSTSRTN
jgi:hypothetical protein